MKILAAEGPSFLQTDGLPLIDSVSTEHMLLLLELPELLDRRLKHFFGHFPNYKSLFRVPRVSERLVKISKNPEYLRKIPGDPGRSALYAGSILGDDKTKGASRV
ncbi:MAG: hypothetical protein M1550_05460 [Deltaproteobacteria bacterium]|nr:hypothetical protein [Deltaproteobacteria bacterium]